MKRVQQIAWAVFMAIYIISPIDLLPGLPFDDIAVLIIGLVQEGKLNKNTRIEG